MAVILSTIEESLSEKQEGEITPSAYFVAFLALLEQSCKNGEISQKELATSAVYFLDLVAPYAPKNLLQWKFETILQILAPAITSSDADAPLVRSALGALESLLVAQDSKAWNSGPNSSPKRGIIALLTLSLDPRPKVRKRAQDAVTKILANPPPSPTMVHPAASLCSSTALKAITSLVNDKSIKISKTGGSNSKLIHALQLITSITKANGWPITHLEELCDALLSVSKSTDQYLISAAFKAFEGLFQSMTDEIDLDKLTSVLKVLFDLKPSINDAHLAGSWLAVVAQAGSSYSSLHPIKAFQNLPDMFDAVIPFLQSENASSYISASQCLIALISTAIPTEVLLPVGGSISKKSFQTNDKVLGQLSQKVTGLFTIQYKNCAKEIMEVVATLFDTYRWRSDPHLLGALKIVGELLQDDNFELRKEAEEGVIGAAIRAIGPEKVLELLPLNLENPSLPGRVWLLPILRDNVRNAQLGYFIKYFIPLSERFYLKVSETEEQNKTEQTKIYETLVNQIWALLPHFCDLPIDLRESFTQDFAVLLCNTMLRQEKLRSNICQALKLLVQSNVAYSEGAMEDDVLMMAHFPISESKKNIEYLLPFTSNLLSVLYNVFSQTTASQRSFISECINVYLSITPADVLANKFNNACTLFKKSLDEESVNPNADSDSSATPKNSINMMDLIVTMSPYLPKSSHGALLNIGASLLNVQNGALQKRAYRVFLKLSETEDGKETLSQFVGDFEKALTDSIGSVVPASRGVRLQVLSQVVDFLPITDLHFILGILPEAIISTKDVNEKSREAAYKLLVDMGNKFKNGGTVQNSKIPDMGEDAPDVEANLQEFFTMVLAGLQGTTPHMISATITALSRVLFEFNNDLDKEFLYELSTTISQFLTSNNREIAKSTIGFVKIICISLPEELVKRNLKELVQSLMVWSHEHKGHFKLKVKHIIERLIRRFGYELIEEYFPEEDMKLLTNIRKSKERARRKKAADVDTPEQSSRTKSKFASEYDEALYGSSDESDDNSDEEMEDSSNNKNNKSRNKKPSTYILESNNEPLDLLDNKTLAHISSSKPGSQKKNTSHANKFKTTKDGKFIFEEGKEVDDPYAEKKGSGIDAYLEAVKQGPVRGQRNKLKYKRTRTNVDSDGDEDMDIDDEPKKTKFVKKNNIQNKKRFKSNRKF